MNTFGWGIAAVGTLLGICMTAGLAYLIVRLVRRQSEWVRHVWEQAGQRVNGHYENHKLKGELQGVSYSCCIHSWPSLPCLEVKVPTAIPGAFYLHLTCRCETKKNGQSFWDMCRLSTDDLALTDRFSEELQERLCALGEVEITIKKGRLIFERPQPGLEGTHKLYDPERIVQVITSAVEVTRALAGGTDQGAYR